jgi:DNA transformation protein
MPVSQGFLDFVTEQLERCGAITAKRMFGAVGIYAGDVFFAIISNDVLYLKVDGTNRDDFERAGCGPFRPYGDDRETMQYYNVPVSVLEDGDTLTAWGKRALAVAARNAARNRKPSAGAQSVESRHRATRGASRSGRRARMSKSLKPKS